MIPTFTDPDTLREHPRDPHALERALEEHLLSVPRLRESWQQARATHGEGSDEAILACSHLGRQLQKLAQAASLLDRHDEAAAAIEEVIGLWQQLGRGRATHLCRLHRAEISSRAGETDEAEALFLTLEREQREQPALSTAYGDTLHEAQARHLASTGAWREALGELERALAARVLPAAHPIQQRRAELGALLRQKIERS